MHFKRYDQIWKCIGESQIKSKPNQSIKKGIYGIGAILNRKVSILKIDSYK